MRNKLVQRLLAISVVLIASMPTLHAAEIEMPWPPSPEFKRGLVIPSQPVGAEFLGWTDVGGAWLGDSGRDGTELWALNYERDGEATVAVVTPLSFDSDGSVAEWRVVTSLHMTRDGEPPTRVAWHACWLLNDDQSVAYARWSGSGAPIDAWTFDLDREQFISRNPDEVDCYEEMH